VRRVLAAGAGFVLLWTSSVLAPSAGAHDGHTDWYKWREPEENSDVSGEKVNVRAKVQFPEGVKRWTLEILPPDGYATVQSWGTVCEGTPNKKPKTVEITCEWNSATYPDGKPSRNQAYRARVKAWSEDNSAGAEQTPEGGGSGESTTSSSTTSTTAGSDTSSSSSSSSSSTSSSSTSSSTTTTTEGPAADDGHDSGVRTLVVANPPGAPEGVHLAYAKKTSEVTVSWTANPEPDVAYYLVEEKFNDGEWSLAAKTTDITWTKRLDEKGAYRFRVAAVRWVGSTQRVKEGPRREPQSGLRKVEADPGKNTTESTRPEQAAGSGRKRDEQDAAGKKKDDQQPQPEGSTSSTAPPDSVIVNYDGGADPAATPTTAAAQPGASGPSGVSSIQPGSPGSVQTRYADPPRLPAPVSPEQAYDPGFSLALPYPKEVRLDIGPPPAPPPRLLGTVVLFDSNEAQRRGLVGVLAGGLVIFMLSMQAAYLNRRPRPIDLAASADWD
jgi:hypothetical protein